MIPPDKGLMRADVGQTGASSLSVLVQVNLSKRRREPQEMTGLRRIRRVPYYLTFARAGVASIICLRFGCFGSERKPWTESAVALAHYARGGRQATTLHSLEDETAAWRLRVGASSVQVTK